MEACGREASDGRKDGTFQGRAEHVLRSTNVGGRPGLVSVVLRVVAQHLVPPLRR